MAGTSALHRVLGVNFPLLAIYEHLRMPVQVTPNAISIRLDRALVNRYAHDLEYAHVYVDLDDTLIVRGEVDAGASGRLSVPVPERRAPARADHAARARRGRDARASPAERVPDELVELDSLVEKAERIPERDAILIDDSFRERRVAGERLGIPTFDSSMLEMLMDDRL